MSNPLYAAMLAQIPSPTDYFNPYKLGAVAVVFFAWVAVCQWVDRDADRVKTKREQWNLIVVSGGLVGLFVLFVVPWHGNTFFLGMAFWLVFASGACLAYVIHRNGRVVKRNRVLTLGYFRRTVEAVRGGQRSSVDKGQRVRLIDAEGSAVTLPEDSAAADQYALVQDFLFDVLWRRASVVDLHSASDGPKVRYIIDGVATEAMPDLEPFDAERIILYLKTKAGLNPEEIRRPQEGSVRCALLGDTSDPAAIVVKTSGSTSGERLRLHVQRSESLKRLEDVGLAPDRLAKVKRFVEHPSGLVVCSGPRQSGVTTTTYAVLRAHDAFMQSIYTIERNPLIDLDNVKQYTHQDGDETTSFARNLQTVLRREPDVVLVGECRDRDTARIACRAAAEERKIYLTIEGNDCIDALGKLLGLVDDHEQVAQALIAVVNQRLVRLLCPACRQAYRPDEQLLRKANLPLDKIEHFHRPCTEPVLDRKGKPIICQTCQGTGYVGRTGLFEVLEIDDAIRKLIAARSPSKQIKAQSRKNKMYFLQEEGLLKVIDGTTSLNEVLRSLRTNGK